jgi:RNA polymerase sigma-70 factor (ECF subfamily)
MITLDVLYERYAAQIRSFLYQSAKNAEVADDLMQIVFLKAWRALPRLAPESNIQAWLYQIARRTAIDEARYPASGRHPQQCSLEERISAAPDDLEDAPDTTIEQMQVRQALSALPMKECRVLLLFYVYGLSIRELVLHDQISEANVKARLSRARKHFVQVYCAMQEEDKEEGAAA